MVMNRVGVNGAEGARTASSLTLLAGTWLIITPFWMGYWVAPARLWNSVLVGIVVGVLALIRAFAPTQNAALSWINLILGIWLMVSPFILPYQQLAVPLRYDVMTGILIGVLSLWSALATPSFARSAR
ncbi:MAG TPA: SPW repeat protein [Gemmataceae bacterium]|nr:SPW repeat protein [Gemmataceae bacterium]